MNNLLLVIDVQNNFVNNKTKNTPSCPLLPYGLS